MNPPLMIISGFTPKKAGFHKNEIGELSGFDRADLGGNAVRDGRIDGVFGDVAFGAVIIIARGIFGERAALRFHFVRGLPGARDDFADASHGLRIAGEHADHAQVVENIFRGDGFRANAAFGEGDVFGHVRIQMMADHQHVEMLGDGVDGVWTRGIGRGRQNIWVARRCE